MNLRFPHFCIDFTLLTALLAQCLALPSDPSSPAASPSTLDCKESFKVIITNNRTKTPGKTKRAGEASKLHAYVSGQVDDKYGMLTWDQGGTEWHTLEAPSDTNVSVHKAIDPGKAKLAKPIGDDNIEFCMPKNVISGRIYIVEGELEFKTFLSGDKTLVDEPSAVASGTDAYGKRWSFLEFTYEEDHIVVNLSFVDWVSLALGFTLTTNPPTTGTSENPPVATHDVPGLKPESLEKICEALKKQSKADGLTEWENLCVCEEGSEKLLRVLSPNQYATLHPEAWEGYYDAYWDAFGVQTREKNFSINTQDKAGKKVANGDTITCNMPTNTLLCSSTTSPSVTFEIGRPEHITEIWGCNGGMFDTAKYLDSPEKARMQYLEILPRLCAAMVRSTLLLDGGHVQPNGNIQPDKYYKPGNSANGTAWPTNHYSRIVHDFLKNNTGYAFAYDDVGPEDVDSAGLIDTYHPRIWNITLSN